jgi:uncharacterized membrane protein (UPF0127 family)
MHKNKMKLWPMYSLLGVLLIMGGSFGVFFYLELNEKDTNNLIPKVENVSSSVSAALESKETASTTDSWEDIYPDIKPMKIAEVEILASVAKSWPDRIKGLSDTPYLPENVVKLFIFDTPGFHSIWMKDMNYAIDIIWVDDELKIVHIERQVPPESYPGSFVTKVPAKYVIETVSGFVDKYKIALGQEVVLPK